MSKRIVFLGLGANLRLLSYGNIKKLFSILHIRLSHKGLRVLKKSDNWKSTAIPYSAGPTFINCVFKCKIINEKIVDPHKLHQTLKDIEIKIGKKKGE